MSGPKCFEVTETTLRQARRSNRAQCDTALAEYRRLFGQCSELAERARNLELTAPSPTADPVLLARRVEAGFANARNDGLDVVLQIRREKELLEAGLGKLTAAVREQVAALQRRVRELRQHVGQLHEERAKLERGLETALPANWPAAEVASIRASAATRLQQLVIPDPVESAETPEEIACLRAAESAVAAARCGLTAAVGQFEQAVRDTHARLVTAHLAAGRAPVETLQDYLAKQAPVAAATTATTAKTSADTYAEKAEQLLAELSLLQNHASWSSLRERAAAIERETDPAFRRTQYEALALDCSARLKNLKAHTEWRARLEALLDRTSTATGPVVERLRGQLQTLLRAGNVVDLGKLERELTAAVAAADQRRLADERRQAILESLAAIGYELDGAPMETAVVSAGKLVIRKPGNAEYAVELVVNSDLSLLQTAMVRHADTAELTEQQRLRDCEQEESWCGDHARLRDELARRGFDSAFKLKLPSGQHPVRVIVRSAEERARHRADASPLACAGDEVRRR